ncbi:MAG: ABC transporter C-terminal domain-containing protein, partial [Gemmatimonadota bacterium]|nr:ABC transporter C-terminal domain-containing protein [Gemmatimonadota bacterium]
AAAKSESKANKMDSHRGRGSAQVATQGNQRHSGNGSGGNAGNGSGSNAGNSSRNNVKQNGSGNNTDAKKAARQAQKALADVELRVATLEERIAEISTALEDLTLYDTPAGTKRAGDLGKSLDEHRDLLDEAMHDWNAAAEHAQGSGRV